MIIRTGHNLNSLPLATEKDAILILTQGRNIINNYWHKLWVSLSGMIREELSSKVSALQIMTTERPSERNTSILDLQHSRKLGPGPNLYLLDFEVHSRSKLVSGRFELWCVWETPYLENA